jgi:hypothetical protein
MQVLTASTMTSLTLVLVPTTPPSRRSLSHYQGRQIDNTNLLDSIDQIGSDLTETLALVDLI